MNKVILIGRLTRDAEGKYTQTGIAVSNFTVAVDRMSKGDKKEADFINIIAFGKLAENVIKFTGKGRLVAVSGRIQTRSYDAKDGTKRYVTEVVADEVKFLEWGNKQESNSNGYSDMTPIDDGSIPF